MGNVYTYSIMCYTAQRTRMHFQRNNKTLLLYTYTCAQGGVCHKFDRVRYILVKGPNVSNVRITAEVDKFYDWVSLL